MHLLEPDFHPLPEREDIGHALSLEEANSLLETAIKSRSRSLFPALMIFLHTGVAANRELIARFEKKIQATLARV